MKAYITGTDRGLGFGLATKFLEQGHEVYAGFYGIEAKGLEQLKARYGNQLVIVPLDISKDDSVRAAAALIAEHTGSLDLLINNAAIIGQRNATILDDISFDDMLDVYNVNALGPLRVAKSVIGLLRSGDGKKIVNISSEAGSMTARVFRQQTTRYGYCASKSALNVQSILLQNHLQEFGIRVFLIEPGWVSTYLADGKKCPIAPIEPEESAAKLLEFLNRPQLPEYMFHDLFKDQQFAW